MKWFFIAAVIFAIVVTALKSRKVSNTRSVIKSSPKLQAIYDYIFQEEKPGRIAITRSNEIFFGPVGTQYIKVPGDMVPAMNENDRLALGYELQAKCGYGHMLCNGAGHQHNVGDTGNNYIDNNVEFLLIGSNASAAGW